MLTLKDQCRRDRAAAALQAHHGPNPASSSAAAAASDGLTFSRATTNGSRPVDDIQVLQIRQLAGVMTFSYALFCRQ